MLPSTSFPAVRTPAAMSSSHSAIRRIASTTVRGVLHCREVASTSAASVPVSSAISPSAFSFSASPAFRSGAASSLSKPSAAAVSLGAPGAAAVGSWLFSRRSTSLTPSAASAASTEASSGGSSKASKKSAKDGPKRPLTAYLLFSLDERKRVVEENPGMKFGEVGKALGERWKKLPESEKAVYLKKAQAEKARYEEEVQRLSQK